LKSLLGSFHVYLAGRKIVFTEGKDRLRTGAYHVHVITDV